MDGGFELAWAIKKQLDDMMGENYVYIDAVNQSIENREQLAVSMSDRHFGIGGIISCPPDCVKPMFPADPPAGRPVSRPDCIPPFPGTPYRWW